jgi:ATP-binding cassette subfamily F protein 3
MTRAMGQGASPGAVRAQLGRFGFSGPRATQKVGKLSGGERARLALALITREAPHLLILDEPTNHLDVDAREALVQALNDYDGAVVLVSHDRHMLELTADRLVLVDGGTARDYAGSMDDYTDLILSKGETKGDGASQQAKAAGGGGARKEEKRSGAQYRERLKALRAVVRAAEKKVEALTAEIRAIDDALADPTGTKGSLASVNLSDLMKKRSELESQLERAEAQWMAAEEAIEGA